MKTSNKPGGLAPLTKRLFNAIEPDELAEVLIHNAAPPPEEGEVVVDPAMMLLEKLSDPAFAHKSLPVLARECGITASMAMDMIRRYRLDMAMLKMTGQAERLLSDIATDAQTQIMPCPVCPLPEANQYCPTCGGNGQIRRVGDKEARKIASELLFPKGPAVALNVNNTTQVTNQTLNVPSSDNAVSRITKLLDAKKSPT